MDNKELRDKIATILVNNSMPTRQVVIGEIVALMDLQREELAKEIIDELESNPNFIGLPNIAMGRWIEDKQSQLKSKYLKKLMEKETSEGWIKDLYVCGATQAAINAVIGYKHKWLASQKEKMLGVLEGMEKDDDSKPNGIERHMEITGYNEAIDDIKKKIEEL